MTRPERVVRSSPQVAAAADGAELLDGSEAGNGTLRMLTATWEDLQKTRLASAQRGQDELAAVLQKQEDRYARLIRRELERHPVWAWLAQFPGLGGVHTARLVGLIGDARRFPGQRCDKGHYSAPIHDIGATCPAVTIDGPCDGAMLAPRPHTGTRSVWHWAGLMPGARRQKGQRADYNPAVKTLLLMPGGLAEQIVRLRVPVYRDIYDATKERLSRERAVEAAANDLRLGPLPNDAAEAGPVRVTGVGIGLRPFRIDAIARKVAVKAFVADLLREMKRLAAESPSVGVVRLGGESLILDEEAAR